MQEFTLAIADKESFRRLYVSMAQRLLEILPIMKEVQSIW